MFYAILGILVVAALFLIFRDDHDKSYNKSEKGSNQTRQQTQYQKSEPKAEQPKADKKASGPSLKEQILGDIESAIKEAQKSTEEPLNIFRTVMDETKAAINSAINEAGQKAYWTQSEDVDEQEQPEEEEEEMDEEEELDLSFLDTLDYYEELEENTDTFDITGLRYHCSVYDCGTIVGYVKPEPSNVHDARAQAVFRSDGKLLGYIPRAQLDWYEDFNQHNVICPFIGEIEIEPSTARLIAEIKVILPVSQEFVLEEMADSSDE